jgi:hypothetical protein
MRNAGITKMLRWPLILVDLESERVRTAADRVSFAHLITHPAAARIDVDPLEIFVRAGSTPIPAASATIPRQTRRIRIPLR